MAGDLCWVYVMADPVRAGNALLTVLVDDLDARIAELAGRGIATGPVEGVNGVISGISATTSHRVSAALRAVTLATTTVPARFLIASGAWGPRPAR